LIPPLTVNLIFKISSDQLFFTEILRILRSNTENKGHPRRRTDDVIQYMQKQSMMKLRDWLRTGTLGKR